MAKTNTNISGQDWHLYRRAVDRLRSLYSWNELSKALGHSARGFAKAAYDNKHVCNIATVQKAQDLLNTHRKEGDLTTQAQAEPATVNGHPPALHGTLTEDASAYIDACDKLRDVYLADWDEVHEAVGSTSPYQTYRSLKVGDYTDIRSSSLGTVQRLLARCRHGEAPWQDVLVVADPAVPKGKAFVDAIDELREDYGPSFPDMESATGVVLSSYYDIRNDSERGVRNSTLRKVLELLHKAKRGQAPWQDGEAPAEAPMEADAPASAAQQSTPDEAEDAPTVPTSMEDVQRAVFQLGATVDTRVGNIVQGLEKLRDAAPKMMRVAYDAEIDRLRTVADTVTDLLDDFES